MIKNTEDSDNLIGNEEFEMLNSKKKECLTQIEPAYFEENQIQRNGRDDREFLLEELGDCKAVRELLEVN